MSDPTQPSRRSVDDTSGPAMPRRPDVPSTPSRKLSAPRRWLLPAATVLLATLGAGALVAAALSPADGSTPTTAAIPQITPTPDAVPTIAAPATAPTTSTTGAVAPLVVSELADPAWVTRIAEATGIPARALAAYAGAAIETSRSSPSCGLGWNTLAAVGLVESEHGTLTGAGILADGRTVPTIIGVPLDGDGVAKVPDTDAGLLDGDTLWDHAVGPMQFIPSTWAAHAKDGNGDGTADINQIDDAALTAAVYLCEAGGDLTQPAAWISAIAAYNPDADYNNRVAEAANHYATVS